MSTPEITTRDIGECYVALTIGLTRAAQWYATVLDTSIAKGGEPDRQAVVVLCNHLQRCGPHARFLQAHMGRCVSDARLAYIRQTNIASNLKELARAGAIQKSALMDFVPEHLSVRQVVPLQWPQGSPHTFIFTPEHPPLFFCHDLGAVHGLQLGIKLHGVLINDGSQYIAPHENVMKCILANGQGKLSPPPSMRRDFDLAIWIVSRMYTTISVSHALGIPAHTVAPGL
ncbi:hypothetical protein PENSPDRAFT_720385 [Peniophora sp. CONT]|nr:hypothetical protein PENSPDRAFT_720385 [Peniophora sp. CONT]